MAADEVADLLRHGEGHHEVVTGKLARELAFQPLPTFMILALRAMAVAAGAEEKVLLAAVFAFVDERAVLFGLAVDDRRDHLFMLGRHHIAVEAEVLRGIGAENVVNLSHGYPP